MVQDTFYGISTVQWTIGLMCMQIIIVCIILYFFFHRAQENTNSKIEEVLTIMNDETTSLKTYLQTFTARFKKGLPTIIGSSFTEGLNIKGVAGNMVGEMVEKWVVKNLGDYLPENTLHQLREGFMNSAPESEIGSVPKTQEQAIFVEPGSDLYETLKAKGYIKEELDDE